METIPTIGLGTWKLPPVDSFNVVLDAVRLGYRHIDCSSTYGNEKEIGRALQRLLAEGTIKRDELWITSKLPNTAHDPESVPQAIEKSLHDLQLDYLDAYLMHWPVAMRPGVWIPRKAEHLISLQELPLEATWSAMEKLVDDGRVMHLGVSNFSVFKLANLVESMRIPPKLNQVELHPYLQQSGMLEYCQAQRIQLVAYAPLGSSDRPKPLIKKGEPVLLDDPVVKEIAREHGVVPSMVLLAWALQRGTAIVAKAANPRHLRENLLAADLRLTDEDMHRIQSLDRHYRYLDGRFWVLPNGPYTLSNLWDE